jgi:cyanophycin synthetase
VYKVVIRAWQKDVSMAALNMGHDLLMAAIEDRPYDVDAAVLRLRDLVDTYMLGPSTRCIVEAAADKTAPHPLHPPAGRRQPGAAGLWCPPAPHLDG